MNEMLKVWKGQKVGDNERKREQAEERKQEGAEGGGEVDNGVK